MGRYASVRGWFECDENDLDEIKSFLNNFKGKDKHIIKPEEEDLYKKGWTFQASTINWTSYVFYGADIRVYGIDYVKDMFESFVKNFPEVEGYIKVNIEDESYELTWRYGDGEFIEDKVEI